MLSHKGTTAIRIGAEVELPRERFLAKISYCFFCLIWAALFLLSPFRSSCRAFLVKVLAEVLPEKHHCILLLHLYLVSHPMKVANI